MGEMDLAIQEFLIESRENLDQLDRDLIAIEKDPGSREMLDSIFRTFHTIKGTCGFFDFPRLETVSHAGEGLLCDLREGRLAWSPAITGILLELVDVVRRHLAGIERTGTELEEDDRLLVEALGRLRERGRDMPARRPSQVRVRSQSPLDPWRGPRPPRHRPPGSRRLARRAGGRASRREPERGDDPRRCRPARQADEPGRRTGAGPQPDPAVHRQPTTPPSPGAVQRLNLITTELQEGVMKTRMQPIGNIWTGSRAWCATSRCIAASRCRSRWKARRPRLDKTIIEAIKDPLTHLVRNAVDHGIEMPEERLAAGQAARRDAAPARLPRRRAGQHRDHRRRRGHRLRARIKQKALEREPDHRPSRPRA